MICTFHVQRDDSITVLTDARVNIASELDLVFGRTKRAQAGRWWICLIEEWEMRSDQAAGVAQAAHRRSISPHTQSSQLVPYLTYLPQCPQAIGILQTGLIDYLCLLPLFSSIQ